MEVRKIALQLSGKLPPDYKKYNRLEFMEYLEEIFEIPLEKIEFYRNQANQYEEEFYFLVLDFLQRKSEKEPGMKEKWDKLLVDLNLDNTPDSLVLQESYKNEAEFTTTFLVPFFKKLGYKDVRYTHGVDEFGKDIVMKKINELGEYRYIGVQAKYGNINATATAKGSITGIITQAKKCFDNEYEDLEVNKRVRIAEYFIATSGKISKQAITEIMNIDPAYFKNNIHFLDKTKIENLLLEIEKS